MGQKAGVEIARQIFLYGNGDGKNVSSAEKLAELSGLHVKTIYKHLPGWVREREEIVSKADTSALGISLSSETIAANKRFNKVLEDQTNQLAWELDKLSDIAADLREWARETSDEERAMKLLETYLRTVGAKSTVRSQFLAYQKSWANALGVEGMKDVSLTAAKALATGKAKIDLKKMENEGAPKPVGPSAGGVFARIAPKPTA